MSTVHKIRIRTVAHGGAGVGAEVDGDGRTWFVEGALPGELVEASARKQARRFVQAQMVSVLEPASIRVRAPCPLADACGGCGWQFVDPAAQAGLKQTIVADQLRRLPVEVRRATASPAALGYRRRARLHYVRTPQGLVLGFHRTRSHEIVDVRQCPVLRPELDAAVQRVRALAPFLPEQGELHAISDGAAVVLGLPGVRPAPELERACEQLLDDVLVGFVIRGGRKRRGIGRTELEIDAGAGLSPAISGPFSFAQAQREQNVALVEHVVRSARPQGKRVLELYAGTGNFTRALARFAQRVWTFDEDRDAVEALRRLARERELSINAKHGGVEVTLRKLAAAGQCYDVVVLDPPRGGVGESVSRDLARVAGERIVYVSCDPATLARDCAVLIGAGFRVEEVRVFDMMPMTSEVEVVATLVATSARRGAKVNPR